MYMSCSFWVSFSCRSVFQNAVSWLSASSSTMVSSLADAENVPGSNCGFISIFLRDTVRRPKNPIVLSARLKSTNSSSFCKNHTESTNAYSCVMLRSLTKLMFTPLLILALTFFTAQVESLIQSSPLNVNSCLRFGLNAR